jgi:hypothetical protein
MTHGRLYRSAVDEKQAIQVAERWMLGDRRTGAGLIDLMGKDEAASRALNEAGIPGIRYYDGSSRYTAGGTLTVSKQGDQWQAMIQNPRGTGTGRKFPTEAEARSWGESQLKEPTRNIVVFNPDDITQVKRDGELVFENKSGLKPSKVDKVAGDLEGGLLDTSFLGRRTEGLETQMMGSVDEAKTAGDRLAEVNERLRFAERIQDATSDELRRLDLDLRRRIKELEVSAETNPTAVEPLRQAKLMLETMKNPDVSSLTKQSDVARKAFDDASAAMKRATELRNKSGLL